MRVVLWLLVGFAVLIGGAMVLGPREAVDRKVAFDAGSLGEDLDAWLAEREADVPDLRANARKRIVWAGAPGEQTPLSVIYLHGFSASAEEIRPVPEKVAEALGANLFYTRLAGHGRDGAAMAEASAGDWIVDAAEALAIGRRIGERVLVIATSQGGTLASLVAADPDLSEGVAGFALVSPNFGLTNPAGMLLSLPWARHWVPLLIGPERGFEPINAAHATGWTHRYPSTALVPMKALVDRARKLDPARIDLPALFLFSEADTVVSAKRTHSVADAWGGPSQKALRVMGPTDDPASHVIAGDILSPGQTDETVRIITDWARGL